ncbi:hypothetical protein JCM10212_000203 [Sporobolomyces blumeae]
MTISQEKVGKLLEKASDPQETEEVLLAYCYSKWTNGGNQAQVLRKLHLLTLYLRAINLGRLMRDHYQAFAIVASLTKQNARPVVVLPSSALGLEAWNAARRPSKSVLKRVFEGTSRSGLGGGGGGAGVYGASSWSRSGTGSSESSDVEFEQLNGLGHHASTSSFSGVGGGGGGAGARRTRARGWSSSSSLGGGGANAPTGSTFGAFMAGRRSRSNTTTSMSGPVVALDTSVSTPSRLAPSSSTTHGETVTFGSTPVPNRVPGSTPGHPSSTTATARDRNREPAVLVVDQGERGQEARRLAGAGSSDGLGRGLLSAPPNYDGNLTSYLLASSPLDPATSSHLGSIVGVTRVISREDDDLPGYA